jgi:hypothetical protein
MQRRAAPETRELRCVLAGANLPRVLVEVCGSQKSALRKDLACRDSVTLNVQFKGPISVMVINT